MDGRDLKSAFDQLEHHGIDFGLEQHEIAHDHGFPMHRFERDPTTKGERGLDGDAIERHVQVSAREAVTVNVARHGRLSPKSVVDLLPIDLLRVHAVCKRSRDN